MRGKGLSAKRYTYKTEQVFPNIKGKCLRNHPIIWSSLFSEIEMKVSEIDSIRLASASVLHQENVMVSISTGKHLCNTESQLNMGGNNHFDTSTLVDTLKKKVY